MPAIWTSPVNSSTARPGSGRADRPDAIHSASPACQAGHDHLVVWPEYLSNALSTETRPETPELAHAEM